MSDNTFKKGERLKSRHEIDRLFLGNSRSVSQYPLRLIWIDMEVERSAFPIQLAISIPKRRFKKAVDRNSVRRVVRESFRLRKAEFYTHLKENQPQQAWMLIYMGREKMSFQDIDQSMAKLLKRFLNKNNRSKPTK